MPLQKQLVPLVLAGGIDTKTDPKQVVAGKLLQLENATFVSPKQLKKAPGYVALPTTILGDVTNVIDEGEGLMGYQGELILASANRLYSFAAASNAWADKGSLLSVSVGGFHVNRDPAAAGAADCAIYPTATGGFALFAWEEYSGADTFVNYCVMDLGTQQLVLPSTRTPSVGMDARGSSPRCFAFGPNLVLLWADQTGAVLSALPIPITSPQNHGAVVTLASDLDGGVYDACINLATPPFPGYPEGNTIYVAYSTSVSSSLGIAFLTYGMVASSTSVASSGDATQGVSIVPSSNDEYSITYCGASDVRNMVLNGALDVVLPDASIEAVSAWNVGATFDEAKNTVVWYTVKGSPTWKSKTRTNTRSNLGTVGTPAAFSSLYLSSKPFVANGITYMLMGYASGSAGIQNTYFLLAGDGSVQAKVLGNGAGGFPTTHGLPQVVLQASGAWLLATQVQDLLVSSVSVANPSLPDQTSLFSLTGVQAVELTLFQKGISYSRAELADTLHITGGYLSMYDGAEVVEHGFHLWPEQLSVAPTSGSDTGTYSYVGVYEWTDAVGNRFQSAPSQPYSLVLNSAGAIIDGTHPATVTFPCLRVTEKHNVVLVVYRTELNGTQYFRVTDVLDPTLSTSADTVTITDDVTDAALLAGQNLYTFGGVVENVSPPACSAIATGSNRLWVLDTVNPLQVWYSKQVVPGTPAQFSDLFVLNVDPRGGPVTAIANMDDYQVLFKESSIFIVAGDGPDDTGQQNTFQSPKLVSTDSGCVDPRSVVLFPGGLLYKSAKGIQLLNRGLATDYIGADVEHYNGLAVVSANLVADRNQVRFNLEDGTQLVYDYFMQQWSTRPLFGLVDATIRQQQYFYLDAAGLVYAEDPNSFAIGGRSYALKLQTAWLALGSVNGFQRVYGFMLLGDWKSPHTLRISVSYDYDDTPKQITDVTAEAYDPGYWGDGATWGSDDVWGGLYPLYQIRCNFDRQKCAAVKLTIEDIQVNELDINGNPAPPGEGYSISNLAFIVGVKEGWNKVGAERVVPVVSP